MAETMSAATCCALSGARNCEPGLKGTAELPSARMDPGVTLGLATESTNSNVTGGSKPSLTTNVCPTRPGEPAGAMIRSAATCKACATFVYGCCNEPSATPPAP